MLRVTVELVSHGGRQPLGQMFVGNVSDLADVSAYEISASEAVNPLNGAPAWTARAEVVGHDRRQSVWRLVAAAATAIDKADKVEWRDP